MTDRPSTIASEALNVSFICWCNTVRGSNLFWRFCEMFIESSTGRSAVLQLPCCPSKQRELSENVLQNLRNKLPPHTVCNKVAALVVSEQHLLNVHCAQHCYRQWAIRNSFVHIWEWSTIICDVVHFWVDERKQENWKKVDNAVDLWSIFLFPFIHSKALEIGKAAMHQSHQRANVGWVLIHELHAAEISQTE